MVASEALLRKFAQIQVLQLSGDVPPGLQVQVNQGFNCLAVGLNGSIFSPKNEGWYNHHHYWIKHTFVMV